MKSQTIWKTSIVTTPEAEDAVTELLATLVLVPSPSVYTDADTGTTTVSVYSLTRLTLRRGHERRPETWTQDYQSLRIERRSGTDHRCEIATGKLGGFMETPLPATGDRRRTIGGNGEVGAGAATAQRPGAGRP